MPRISSHRLECRELGRLLFADDDRLVAGGVGPRAGREGRAAVPADVQLETGGCGTGGHTRSEDGTLERRGRCMVNVKYRLNGRTHAVRREYARETRLVGT